MKIPEVMDICKDLLFTKFGVIENPSSRMQWRKLIKEFAAEAEGGYYSKEYVESEFKKLLDATQSAERPSRVYRREALQRHHDYYLSHFSLGDGVLSAADQKQLDLAVEREEAGLVKPYDPPKRS